MSGIILTEVCPSTRNGRVRELQDAPIDSKGGRYGAIRGGSRTAELLIIVTRKVINGCAADRKLCRGQSEDCRAITALLGFRCIVV